jgi:integrase/recombinase XerD
MAARTPLPKRRPNSKPRAIQLPAPSNPLHGWLTAWSEHRLMTGSSAYAQHSRHMVLQRFVAWLDERAITEPAQITRPVIERYQRHLWLARKPNGQPLSVQTQLAALHALIAWFRWLTRERHIPHNPASDLELPKPPKKLPRAILSVAQVEAILAQADTGEPMGLRNRAILEVFYSCGIRRLELIGLKLYDVHVERGMLMVRQGKGGKDRFIPIGERACAWLARYLNEVRPELATSAHEQALFLDEVGRPLKTSYLGDVVKRHIEAAGIEVTGACHLFRHACATHMLEGGADIRFIQAMLGHAQLSTTEVYTHVSIAKLKEIHAATHPAKLERARRVDVLAPSPAADRASTSPRQALAGVADGRAGARR